MFVQMNKPFLFLENLLEILPLCLSEDEEINILGKELLDTYDCCLFPLTMFLLNIDKNSPIPFPFLSSKIEEEFLGETACNAWKKENFYSVKPYSSLNTYTPWWFCPKEMLLKILEIYNGN